LVVKENGCKTKCAAQTMFSKALIAPPAIAKRVLLLVNGRSVRRKGVLVRIIAISVRKTAISVRIIAISVVIT